MIESGLRNRQYGPERREKHKHCLGWATDAPADIWNRVEPRRGMANYSASPRFALTEYRRLVQFVTARAPRFSG